MADDFWTQAAQSNTTPPPMASASPSGDFWNSAAGVGPSPKQAALQTKATLQAKYPQYLKDNDPSAVSRMASGFGEYVGGAVKRALGTEELGNIYDQAKQGNYGKAVLGLADYAVKGPGGRLGDAAVNAQINEAKEAAAYAKAGRPSEAVGHGLAAITPGMGPMAADIAETAAGEPPLPKGQQVGPVRPTNIAGALGKAIAAYSMAKAPDVVEAATPTVKAAAKNASKWVTAPGNAQIVGGAGELTAGVGAAVSGYPVAGAGVGLRGASRIMSGMAQRRAAATAAAEKAASATPTVAPLTIDPNSPGWTGAPVATEPVPHPLSTIAPSNETLATSGTAGVPTPEPIPPAATIPENSTNAPSALKVPLGTSAPPGELPPLSGQFVGQSGTAGVPQPPPSPVMPSSTADAAALGPVQPTLPFTSPSAQTISQSATSKMPPPPPVMPPPDSTSGPIPAVSAPVGPPQTGSAQIIGKSSTNQPALPQAIPLPPGVSAPPSPPTGPLPPTVMAAPGIAPEVPEAPVPQTAPAADFTGDVGRPYPAHYDTHRNPTAAFDVDKAVIGYLRSNGLEATDQNIADARTALRRSPVKAKDLPALGDRVRQTIHVLKQDAANQLAAQAPAAVPPAAVQLGLASLKQAVPEA